MQFQEAKNTRVTHMFYTINNLKYGLFNKINSTLQNRSLKSAEKNINRIAKEFEKFHSVLWLDFMLLHYLAEDEEEDESAINT